MISVSRRELPSGTVRIPFTQQPAHFIIVDLTAKFKMDAMTVFCEGISNFFSVVCSISSGPNKIPYFSLLAISPYTEVLFPAQRITKISYSRIQTAMNELQRIASDCNVNIENSQPDINAIQRSLKDACAQYHKLKLEAGCRNKLEITLVTCHNSKVLKLGFSQTFKKSCLGTDSLLKVLCLNTFEENLIDRDQLNLELEATPVQIQELDLCGFVEIVEVECDVLCIERELKLWLRDASTDREHLQLQFRTREGSDEKTCIKCDLRDMLVDVTELPFLHSFDLGSDRHCDKDKRACSSTRTASKTSSPSPVVVLKAIRRSPINSICESVIFGTPHLICSSNCWQIEWDDLELNRNRFDALCRTLADTQQCVICQKVENQGFAANGSLPRPLYVIMASEDHNSLLVKQIATRELLLLPNTKAECQTTESAFLEIKMALDCVEFDPAFNPLLLNCDLYPALKRSLVSQCPKRAAPPNKKVSASAAAGQQPVKAKRMESNIARCHPQTASGKDVRFSAPRKATSPNLDDSPTYTNGLVCSLQPCEDIRLPRKRVTFPDNPSF